MDEFYGRNMPDAPWDETQFVGALAAVRERFARIFDEDGVEFFERGERLVVGDERRAGDRAPAAARVRTTCWTSAALAERVRERTVAELVAAAPAEARRAARGSAVRGARRERSPPSG